MIAYEFGASLHHNQEPQKRKTQPGMRVAVWYCGLFDEQHEISESRWWWLRATRGKRKKERKSQFKSQTHTYTQHSWKGLLGSRRGSKVVVCHQLKLSHSKSFGKRKSETHFISHHKTSRLALRCLGTCLNQLLRSTSSSPLLDLSCIKNIVPDPALSHS